MSEDIKRKISVEMDSGPDAELEFSEEVKSEIETNEEVRKYADDLMKLESLMDDVRENTESDPDEQSITNSIMGSLKESDEGESGGEDLDELLSGPMPETSEDRDEAGKEDLVEKAQKEDEEEMEEAAGRAPAFSFPSVSDVETGKELKDVLKMEKKSSVPGAAKGDSSGIINMSALVEEHRKSMAPPPPAEAQKAQKAAVAGKPGAEGSGMKVVLAIAAVLVAVVGVVVIIKMSKSSKEGSPSSAVEAAQHEEALKKQLTAELKAEMEKEKAPPVSAAAQAMTEPREEEENEEEAALEGEEGGGEDEMLLASKKKGKKKGKTDLMVDDPYASEPKEAKSGGVSDPQTKKEASKDTLMDLLDTATKEKVKAKEPAKPVKGAVEKKSSPSVEELMGTPKKEEAKKEEAPAGLPATLNKNQIKDVMRKLNPKIQKCGEGKVGNLILMLAVNGDGTVKSAKSSGQFASDPTGKCAEQVAMKAKFPPFSNASANVTYPYVFAPPPGQSGPVKK
ncbi:MAG: hypothetical protein ABIJ56_02900 [Pseudomonadota bacterium]